MNKAYIIIAHKNPEQLFRLVKTLDDGLSMFFIHIDKSISINQFEIFDNLKDKVKFIIQVFSKWSTFGLVQCTLNGIKEVQQSNIGFDRIILLSGQDYPIKSNNYINNYLEKSTFSLFFEYWPLPNYNKWPTDKGGMYRVNKYFFGLKTYQLFLSKSINLLTVIFPFLKRKIPNQIKPFAGSQWWIIDKYAMDYIIDFVKKYPKYINFHKYTFGSDELFFQMILLNSDNQKILNSIKNNNKRFMKWKNSSSAHPEVLDEKDFNDIQKSEALFARKFDLSKNPKILNLIDKNCLLNTVFT